MPSTCQQLLHGNSFRNRLKDSRCCKGTQHRQASGELDGSCHLARPGDPHGDLARSLTQSCTELPVKAQIPRWPQCRAPGSVPASSLSCQLSSHQHVERVLDVLLECRQPLRAQSTIHNLRRPIGMGVSIPFRSEGTIDTVPIYALTGWAHRPRCQQDQWSGVPIQAKELKHAPGGHSSW